MNTLLNILVSILVTCKYKSPKAYSLKAPIPALECLMAMWLSNSSVCLTLLLKFLVLISVMYILLQAMKMSGGGANSVFRHTATPPELYRHTPTPPDKHLRRYVVYAIMIITASSIRRDRLFRRNRKQFMSNYFCI